MMMRQMDAYINELAFNIDDITEDDDRNDEEEECRVFIPSIGRNLTTPDIKTLKMPLELFAGFDATLPSKTTALPFQHTQEKRKPGRGRAQQLKEDEKKCLKPGDDYLQTRFEMTEKIMSKFDFTKDFPLLTETLSSSPGNTNNKSKPS